MSLRIQNNIPAMNAHRNLSVSDSGLSKSLERLSSGYRINRAADDAAGLAISQGMRADIASYKVASRNVSEANALSQVAEGAYDQIGNMLIRLKELATQAASANAATNLDKINDEGNQLIEEIDRIAGATEYAGTKLLDGSFGVTVSASASTFTAGKGYVSASGLQGETSYDIVTTGSSGALSMTITATLGGNSYSQTITGIDETGIGSGTKSLNFDALGMTLKVDSNFTSASDGNIDTDTATSAAFQVGAKNDTTNDRINISLSGVRSTDLAVTSDQMLSAANAQTFLETIDSAIDTLNARRGGIGATQNRLAYASANLATTIENVQSAESVIRDVDMAAEMTTFTKNQILLQAGTAMLAQANMAPQNLLSLFG